MNKLPITVVIPVKNEEKNLPACLSRLSEFEVVLVVDSGSTDGTHEAATAGGAKLLQFGWTGGYPKKRNWVLLNHRFTTPWVLFLDADELVTEAFVLEARQSLQTTTVVGFWVNYANYFLGRRLRHGVPQRKLALFRVGAGLYERIDESGWSQLDMEVHEHPILDGPVGEIKARIDHRDFRTLHEFLDRHNAYSSWEAARFLQVQSTSEAIVHLTPRQRAKYRHLRKWWYPPAYFLFTYVGRLGFMDGRPGLVYALLKMFYFLQVREKVLEAAMRSEPLVRSDGTFSLDGAPPR
jgi:glycosyltransferase involved in cell wall biosynthesis